MKNGYNGWRIIVYTKFLDMCLAIPGKILSINQTTERLLRTAVVSFGGIKKDINIIMVPEAKIDDYVLVHVGVAISVIDEIEAKKTLSYLEDVGS